MLRAVLFADASTRVPLEGASELYRALATASPRAPERPFVYLSTSPWNLADFLMKFMSDNEFPTGSLMLTDWGPGSHGRLRISSSEHKLGALRKVAAGFPNQKLLLLGDSGQADAEIYATFASELPERVAAVYIRNAGRPTRKRLRRLEYARIVLGQHDVPFLVADDSETILRHAVAAGLASSDA